MENKENEIQVLLEELTTLKKEIEETIKFVKSLPDDRRFFLNTGLLCVEMNKEQALKHLEEALKSVEEQIKTITEGGNKK